MWNQKGQQACKLELQAGADPKVLRQNFFLLQEDSVFALKFLVWMDEATTVLRVISSTEVLMMDVSHIHKIASRQHLDECLVNHWRLAWPCWHRRLTITVPVKLYPLKNLSIYIVIIAFCSPLGFAVNYVFCGDQNKWGLLMCVHDRLYGERGYVLERLKCSMPFPDLWSSGM